MSRGYFWTDPRDPCGSLCGEVMLWSLSTSLSSLSNKMLNLLTKSHFNFNLYCGLWRSHVIMTDFVCMNTQKWLVWKVSDICSERKSWNDFYFSAESTFEESVSKQNFYACTRAKKAMSRRHCANIPSNFAYILSKITFKAILH